MQHLIAFNNAGRLWHKVRMPSTVSPSVFQATPLRCSWKTNFTCGFDSRIHIAVSSTASSKDYAYCTHQVRSVEKLSRLMFLCRRTVRHFARPAKLLTQSEDAALSQMVNANMAMARSWTGQCPEQTQQIAGQRQDVLQSGHKHHKGHSASSNYRVGCTENQNFRRTRIHPFAACIRDLLRCSEAQHKQAFA